MPVHAVSEECRSWLLGHRWKLKHGAKVKKGSLFWRDPMKDEHNYYLCLTINCYKYQSSITRLERSEMKIIRSYLPKLNCAAGHGQTHDCGLPERSRVLISGCGLIWDRCRTRVLADSPMALNYWNNFKFTFRAVPVSDPIRLTLALELMSVDPKPSWSLNPFDGGCVNIEFGPKSWSLGDGVLT